MLCVPSVAPLPANAQLHETMNRVYDSPIRSPPAITFRLRQDRVPSAGRAVAVAAAVALALGGCTSAPTPPPRNLVLIVVDTLRADHVGGYGYPRPTTPNLDRLAAEGTVFENAFAQSSWTAPSIASLFTSLYPSSHGVTNFLAKLPSGIPTLAEVLQRQGFRTSAISANFVHVSPAKGFGRGFDSFEALSRPVRPGEAEDLFGQVAVDADAVTERAIAAAGSASGKRIFLYAHFMDPHSNYDPPEPFLRRFEHPYDGSLTGSTEDLKRAMRSEIELAEADLRRLVDLYDAEIAFADAEIGRLLDDLRRRGLYDESVIAVLADHGEEFEDHGGLFHGSTLYEELVRVPLIVRLPGGLGGGARIRELVQVVDVGPTLVEILGLRDERPTQGRSFAPLFGGGHGGGGERRAFAELHPDPLAERERPLQPQRHRSAMTTPLWSWLVAPGGEAELYDRRNDPGQHEDRSPSEPRAAAALGQELASFEDGLRARGTPVPSLVVPDARQREELRALGYVE